MPIPFINRPVVHVHVTDHEGHGQSVQGPSGRSLMRVAVDAGVQGIAADCGGALSCATCHVYVSPAWSARLPPPSADEQSMLAMTAAERTPQSRLSCQIALSPELDGLEVTLPPIQY